MNIYEAYEKIKNHVGGEEFVIDLVPANVNDSGIATGTEEDTNAEWWAEVMVKYKENEYWSHVWDYDTGGTTIGEILENILQCNIDENANVDKNEKIGNDLTVVDKWAAMICDRDWAEYMTYKEAAKHLNTKP